MIMLVTLGAAGWFMLRARHTYAGDVAAAAASQDYARSSGGGGGGGEAGAGAPARAP